MTARDHRCRLTLGDLAPKDARLALAVHRFVHDELQVDWQGAGLTVGLSGGADSTALLVLLAALRDRLSLRLNAAHLDHGLRSESGRDAEAAAELCRRLEVPFRSVRRDVGALAAEKGSGLEEAGRSARYEFLEQMRAEFGADWIVTAHHAGDLAEDVLLRLVRGAAWPGLGGMAAVDGKRHVLRPLLLTDKAPLTEMLTRLGIGWQEDASNAARDFRRNRMRLDVLPLLMKENPAFPDAVRSLWRAARLDEDYWRGRIRAALPAEPPSSPAQGVLLPRAALAALPRAGRLRAYVEAIRRIGNGQARSSSLFALDDAWEKRRHGKTFQFPGGLVAALTADGVLVRQESADECAGSERRRTRRV